MVNDLREGTVTPEPNRARHFQIFKFSLIFAIFWALKNFCQKIGSHPAEKGPAKREKTNFGSDPHKCIFDFSKSLKHNPERILFWTVFLDPEQIPENVFLALILV